MRVCGSLVQMDAGSCQDTEKENLFANDTRLGFEISGIENHPRHLLADWSLIILAPNRNLPICCSPILSEISICGD